VKLIVNFDKTILDRGGQKPGFSTQLSVISKSYCRNPVSWRWGGLRNQVSQLNFLLLAKVIVETRFLGGVGGSETGFLNSTLLLLTKVIVETRFLGFLGTS
jgi:hypothetical protein